MCLHLSIEKYRIQIESEYTEKCVIKERDSMDIRYFELRAANKDCSEKFSDIASKTIDGKSIFELACEYVNSSNGYKRNGRKLEILNIHDYIISVRLSSENKLEMASKSLAGFTRELLRLDRELHPNEAEQFFRTFLYNNTLFKNTQIESGSLKSYSNDEMSDVEALKRCVDLFCNGMTVSKQESIQADRAKKEIKEILMNYNRFTRLQSYSGLFEK